MRLAARVFAGLCDDDDDGAAAVRVPRYDKALFSGKGDRLPEHQWSEVNSPGAPRVQVVLFEGWCLGFRALRPSDLRKKWEGESRTLRQHELQHLDFINTKLRDYDTLTNLFDAFIHLDAEDTSHVYDWRLEQEQCLRAERGGAGMTDEQVLRFVDGYYPAYELYSDGVRAGVFKDRPGHQLRIIVGKDRQVKDTAVI